MNWEQETDRNSSGESGKSSPDPETTLKWDLQVEQDTSMPPPAPTIRELFNMPVNNMELALENLWIDDGEFILIYLLFIFISVFVHLSGDYSDRSKSFPLMRPETGLGNSSLGLEDLATKFPEIFCDENLIQEMFGVFVFERSNGEPWGSSGESQMFGDYFDLEPSKFGVIGDKTLAKKSSKEPESYSEEFVEMFGAWCDEQLAK